MDRLLEIVNNYDETLKEVARLSGGNATLVLASKTVPQETLSALAAARKGVIFGENRVQELLGKYFSADGLTWQFIGRLQTNKVKYIVDKVSMIQSVDSLRLAEEIERRSAKIDKVMDVLIEVNVGGEASKGGVPVAECLSLAERIAEMPHLRLCGLMSVLPIAEEDALDPLYARLCDLFDRLKDRFKDGSIRYLSAGMSGDYPVALRHGSNMVRIGSAVFGARHYDK
ncbi:MAG: YggS family pyridoxal phosphate-dependent enzyme [Clostridia bacterium]|nr:YggS family pyridoxal phosphate-dependent enzyme [Clostridia bacterium]